MCRVLEVSPSGYYAWRKRPVSDRACGDAVLKERITEIFTTSRGRYGAPRVHQALRRNGVRIARKRVARLMQQCSLRARTPRRRVRTTDSNHRHPVAKNLLDRQFTASAAHQKWTSDITYIATHEGWLYLAVVIDLFSRRVVGWSMSQQIDEALVRQAITMALSGKPINRDLLLHSDQGSQYAATGIGQLCRSNAVVQSMSRRGNCWDNAPSESFFGTLKRELINGHIYARRAEARAAIFEYIEVFYNRERLHSTLGYRSPIEFERDHAISNPSPP